GERLEMLGSGFCGVVSLPPPLVPAPPPQESVLPTNRAAVKNTFSRALSDKDAKWRQNSASMVRRVPHILHALASRRINWLRFNFGAVRLEPATTARWQRETIG